MGSSPLSPGGEPADEASGQGAGNVEIARGLSAQRPGGKLAACAVSSRAAFRLDARLEATSAFVADLPLCQARLQEDARYAWLVLIPRRSACEELADLAASDRARLVEELVAAGAAVRAVGAALDVPIERLNHGQLGLMTPQLHWHVVGRRFGDPAWPGPVWGHSPATAYAAADRARAVRAARDSLIGAGNRSV